MKKIRFPGDILKRTGAHNHAPNRSEVDAKLVMEEGKNLVKMDSGPISNVVSHIIGKVDKATAARLPDADSMKRTLRSYRAKNNPLPPNPKSANELTISDEFACTLKGDKFLFCDSQDDGKSARTLVFTTKFNLEVLSSCDLWFADGTFDCVPHLFQQLYIPFMAFATTFSLHLLYLF